MVIVGIICLFFAAVFWYKIIVFFGKRFEKETEQAICKDTFEAMKVNLNYKLEKPEKNLFFRFNAFQNDILLYFYKSTTYNYVYFSSFVILKSASPYFINSVDRYFNELKEDKDNINSLFPMKLRLSTLDRQFFVYCH